MKKKVWKLFLITQSQQEQKWLDKMDEEGWLLTDVGLMNYTFERGTPGSYQYALEWLDYDEKKRKKYVELVSEYGIELVDTFNLWGYFRRPKQDEPFVLFSDPDSLAGYKRRLMKRIGIIALLLLLNTTSLVTNFSTPMRDLTEPIDLALRGFTLILEVLGAVALVFMVIYLFQLVREIGDLEK